MNIPPVDAANIAAQRLDAVAPVNANTVSPTVTVSVTGADAAASIVEFSPLAHLLAVTVLFQTPQAGSSTGSTNLNFQQLAQAAGNFVGAFNSFQNTVNASNATPFESTFDSALLNALQTQNLQTGSASVQSFIDSLAQVGINFQGATSLINPNQFQFNLSALEMAYNANSKQTSALLSNAFQALSSIEQQLLLAQTSQTLNASLMTTQPTSVTSSANRAANNTSPAAGANGTTGSAALNVSGVSGVAGVAGTAAPAAASANAQIAVTASAVAGATASPAVAPPSAAAASTLATLAATINPATTDPIVALAVAAYRVTESMEHTPASQPANPVNEVIPDVTETDRVEPVGPDTPKTQMPATRNRPGH